MSELKLRLMTVLRTIGNQLSMNGRFRLLQSLFRRLFRGMHGTIHINDFDDNLRVKLQLSDHMQRRIFWMGYYNLEIIPFMKAHIQKGMSVIDIGANIGEISLVAANCVGNEGCVVAFEPVDSLANELQSNANRNDLRWLTIVRMGLSDTAAHDVPIFASCGQIVRGEENKGLGSLFGTEGAEPLQHINTTTIDDWLNQHPMDRIDLIKIDIEGAELPCLRGARNALQTFKPMLVVEIQEQTAAAAGYHAQDILDFLAALGYSARLIGRKGHVQPFNSTDSQGLQNVLFLPPTDRMEPL